jgi:hypothetical protein
MRIFIHAVISRRRLVSSINLGTWLVGVFYLLMVNGILAQPVLAAENVQLSMEITLSMPMDKAYHLHVVLANKTNEPIQVDNGQLPWASHSWSTWIKAKKNNATRTPLQAGAPLVEYDGKIVLQSGENLEGDIPLQAMFRAFLAESNRKGVRIEWRCPAELLPVTCVGGKNGSFLISKRTVRKIK